MEERSDSRGGRTEAWIALALCGAVVAAKMLEQLVRGRPAYAQMFAPYWLPVAATGLAAAGILPLRVRPEWLRLRRALHWIGLLLMTWVANGLPLDWLRLTPLLPLPVDWPGLATRTLALAAAIVLAHLALTRPAASSNDRAASWYGYAAFVLALPYPVLRTCWALGGTVGLGWSGAAGRGWTPLLFAIPWLLAAVLSLLLVPTWRRIPRWMLLSAGWSATAIVGLIGPAACWVLVTKLFEDGDVGPGGIATWVFVLFYGSWFVWAIAAGAATRSYQLRTQR